MVSAHVMAAGPAAESLSRLLPGESAGYKAQPPDGVYTADTLFELLNGGADVYRALNVRLVVSRRYARTDAPDVLADVFDMGSASDAYGAFHHDMREGPKPGIGDESELLGGSLCFWKDRYFISVVPLQESPEAAQAVGAIGQAIAAQIPKSGAHPDVAGWLPDPGLLSHHTYYFHDWNGLNRRYFIANENLLDLDRATEGILGRYAAPRDAKTGQPASETGAVVVVIRHVTIERARQALARFQKHYLPEANAEGIARVENGRWTGARLAEETGVPHIVIVFDAMDAKHALEVLRAAGPRTKSNPSTRSPIEPRSKSK